MSDNISPAMLEVQWDGLLEIEEDRRIDEHLNAHFRSEFGMDSNGNDNFDFDPTVFDEEMPIPAHISNTTKVDSSPMLLSCQQSLSMNRHKTLKRKQNFACTQSTSSASAQFVEMSHDDVQIFINNQENKNTVRKTFSDTQKILKFLQQRGESREIFQIPHEELDPLIANFILSVRKPDGTDYEPTSLRNMVSSLDRKLKRHRYPFTIMGSTGPVFSLTRDALKAKQRQLKKDGKGNKPHESQPIDDNEIDILYNKEVLGCSTPQSLLNTMWFNNSIHFGLRGIDEQYQLRWGDVQLHQSSDGVEYLQLNERQTKTRTGDDLTDVRKVAPKMFATGDSRCPVAAYKVYASKRPNGMINPDSPFYVACRTIPIKDPETDQWFMNQRVGKKKLSTMMKTMQISGNLNPAKRLTNHSARKHLVQKLRDSNVAPTDIMQISGHRNIQSVLTYSKISDQQHRVCSDILSNTKPNVCTTVMLKKKDEKENLLTSSEPVQCVRTSSATVTAIDCPTHTSASSQDAFSGVSQHLQSIFAGATLNITNMNLYFNDKI